MKRLCGGGLIAALILSLIVLSGCVQPRAPGTSGIDVSDVDPILPSEQQICKLLLSTVPWDVLQHLGWTTESLLLDVLRTIPRFLEFAEFFAGSGEISAACLNAGFSRGRSLDKELGRDILIVSGCGNSYWLPFNCVFMRSHGCRRHAAPLCGWLVACL